MSLLLRIAGYLRRSDDVRFFIFLGEDSSAERVSESDFASVGIKRAATMRTTPTIMKSKVSIVYS